MFAKRDRRDPDQDAAAERALLAGKLPEADRRQEPDATGNGAPDPNPKAGDGEQEQEQEQEQEEAAPARRGEPTAEERQQLAEWMELPQLRQQVAELHAELKELKRRLQV